MILSGYNYNYLFIVRIQISADYFKSAPLIASEKKEYNRLYSAAAEPTCRYIFLWHITYWWIRRNKS